MHLCTQSGTQAPPLNSNCPGCPRHAEAKHHVTIATPNDAGCRSRRKGVHPSDAIGFLRRQWMIIAASLGVTLLLGAIYILVAPPQYTAKAQLMIDSRKVQPF